MLKTALLALAALSPIFSTASPNARRSANVTTYNPPVLTPFIHIDMLVGIPVNTSTIYGITARYANRGGNVTGSIEGELVPLGAAFEVLPPAANGSVSFFTNQWIINTTSHQTVLMDAKATITYANNALHGFGTINFSSDAPEYVDLNWRNFVAEFEGEFNTGTAIVDIFELGTSGKRDGSATPALLPPGDAPAGI